MQRSAVYLDVSYGRAEMLHFRCSHGRNEGEAKCHTLVDIGAFVVNLQYLLIFPRSCFIVGAEGCVQAMCSCYNLRTHYSYLASSIDGRAAHRYLYRSRSNAVSLLAGEQFSWQTFEIVYSNS